MPERECLAATASLIAPQDVADGCEQRRLRPAPRPAKIATSDVRLSAGPSTSAGNAVETFHHGVTVPVMRCRAPATRQT
jgi:hypothetical protein